MYLLFIAALFIIARTWKQPRCPSADEWISKLWYIYTMAVTQPWTLEPVSLRRNVTAKGNTGWRGVSKGRTSNQEEAPDWGEVQGMALGYRTRSVGNPRVHPKGRQ